jgi:hypothetical protein
MRNYLHWCVVFSLIPLFAIGCGRDGSNGPSAPVTDSGAAKVPPAKEQASSGQANNDHSNTPPARTEPPPKDPTAKEQAGAGRETPLSYFQKLLGDNNPDPNAPRLLGLTFPDDRCVAGGTGLRVGGGPNGSTAEHGLNYRLVPSEADRLMRQFHADLCRFAKECRVELTAGADFPDTGVEAFTIRYTEAGHEGRVEVTREKLKELPFGVTVGKGEAVYYVKILVTERAAPAKP